jgi:conjugal transfer pilus assembly protein TraK
VIEASGLTFEKVGQDVYFMADKEAPVGIFISDGSPGASSNSVASLTLIPRPGLPGQNIMLVMEGLPGAAAPSSAANDEEIAAPPSDYSDAIRQLVVSFVQGQVPNGYQEGELNVGASKVGSVLVVPEKVYVGNVFNIYRYRVENAGKEPIELNETSFHEDGVRAVSFWRNSRLAPGEGTRVFIVSDRSKAD